MFCVVNVFVMKRENKREKENNVIKQSQSEWDRIMLHKSVVMENVHV